jgi:hypothetical protein
MNNKRKKKERNILQSARVTVLCQPVLIMRALQRRRTLTFEER